MPSPVQRLSWEQALAWRMRRHHLVERAQPRTLLRVVSDICGLHAQVASSAELSLWARVDGLSRGALNDELWRKRRLVKLWAMRGTLHLLPARELGTWLAALGTTAGSGTSRHAEIEELTRAVSRALERRILTREELAVAVEQTTASATFAEWIRFSWGSYLKPACFRGQLCFAGDHGGRARFTSPAFWLGGPIEQPSPDEGLRELARRFLAAYAPATSHDLAWWSGFDRRRVRRMLAMLGDDAVEVDVEGTLALMPRRDLRKAAGMEPVDAARLLPAFDPWTVGATRRHPAFLDPRHHARVYRPQGWISPVLLVNGRIVGVWRHEVKKRRLHVELEPFDRLPRWAREQLEKDAERLVRFLDAGLELKVGRYQS
jgi:Winged helix DNA-binding domain